MNYLLTICGNRLVSRNRSVGAMLLCAVLALGACSSGSESSDTQIADLEHGEADALRTDEREVAETQPDPAPIGTPEEPSSPDFELTTLDGKSWRLTDQGDRPKLVMFWATWCPYCKKIFPTVQEIHEVYDPELAVAAISIRDKGDVQAYVDKRGLTMDILVDGDTVGDLYEVPGTPAILLLDGKNNVVFGTLDSDPTNPELRNAVDALMAERAKRV